MIFLYKRRGFFLILFILCCGGRLSAQKIAEPDSLPGEKGKKEYLEMRGVVKSARTTAKGSEYPLDSAIIRIYSDTTKPALLTVFTEKKGKCEFRLPFNKRFFIKISKKGFVTKIVEVNTKIPPAKKGIYIFPFSVDLFKEVYEVDFSILKRPIAKVAFSINNSQFDYDYVYTDRVNAQLKGVYSDYFLLEDALDTTKTEVIVPQDSKKKTDSKKKKK
ncbi:MAG: hypothetical protein IT233_03520 [Bacteroidia bacterium]|nr:hypothetical protein [Bacteroidia bacterium]